MRDYFVLWTRQTPDTGVRVFYADDPGTIGDPDADVYLPSSKIYVRIPDQNLLLRFFNQDTGDATNNFVKMDSFTFRYHEAWGRIFGAHGPIPGGYQKLSDMPTSDAFGALHGRPARGFDGRFIRNPFKT